MHDIIYMVGVRWYNLVPVCNEEQEVEEIFQSMLFLAAKRVLVIIPGLFLIRVAYEGLYLPVRGLWNRSADHLDICSKCDFISFSRPSSLWAKEHWDF